MAAAAATYGGMIQAVGQAMEKIRQEMMFNASHSISPAGAERCEMVGIKLISAALATVLLATSEGEDHAASGSV